MIPTRVLIDWRPRAPWPDEDQVEQDLILTRALIGLFTGQAAPLVALRGGTALHKLVLPEPLRCRSLGRPQTPEDRDQHPRT